MQEPLSMEKDAKIPEYILFLNSLDLKLGVVDILTIENHSADCLTGWTGVKSITCVTDHQEIYDISIRLAWSRQIFKQHLYYGWDRSILIHSTDQQQQVRHRLIIYLCDPATTLVDSIKHQVVADQFIIGTYWKSIHYCYLLLPCQHPFKLPELLNTDDRQYLSLSSSQSGLVFDYSDENKLRQGGLRSKGIRKQGTVDRPLISVITVVYNGRAKIEQTIQSVINQNHKNFEYIIMDGGSTDGTIEIIKKYEHQIDYWKSEQDLGIYDAMNKGIDLAIGQWLNFMNCGDLLYSHQSLSSIPLKSNVDFYYSDAILYNTKGTIELWNCSQEKRVFVHQSIVYSRHLHSSYKYLVHDGLTISDYFFFRRNDAKNWVKLDIPLSIYNTEGISASTSKVFVQKLFVDFMAGDISELKLSLLIIVKILRSPLRIIRLALIKLSILKSARQF